MYESNFKFILTKVFSPRPDTKRQSGCNKFMAHLVEFGGMWTVFRAAGMGEADLRASVELEATVEIVKLSSEAARIFRFRNGDCLKVSDIVLSQPARFRWSVDGKLKTKAAKSLYLCCNFYLRGDDCAAPCIRETWH